MRLSLRIENQLPYGPMSIGCLLQRKPRGLVLTDRTPFTSSAALQVGDRFAQQSLSVRFLTFGVVTPDKPPFDPNTAPAQVAKAVARFPLFGHSRPAVQAEALDG